MQRGVGSLDRSEAEPQSVHYPGPELFDDHVRCFGKRKDPGCGTGFLEIDFDAPLAAVEHGKRGTFAVNEGRRPGGSGHRPDARS